MTISQIVSNILMFQKLIKSIYTPKIIIELKSKY